MRKNPTSRARTGVPRLLAFTALIVAAALFAAGCSGDSTDSGESGTDASGSDASGTDASGSDASGTDSDAGPDADDAATDETDGAATDDADETGGSEPEPEPEPEPAAPDVRTLALMPDPVGSTDPLETVNHLPSVQVFRASDADGGGIAFVFDSLPEVGNRILITPPGLEIFCDMWPEGDTVRVECGGYNRTDNTFLDQMPIPQVDTALGYGFVVPMTIDAGFVTITHNGTPYSAAEVRVAQEPAFVQIDINTGGLAAEVIRTVGIATAAEIETALS